MGKIEYQKFIDKIVNEPLNNIIIYGKNNCGKTYLQKEIAKQICNNNKKIYFSMMQNDGEINDVIFVHYLDVDRVSKLDINYANPYNDIEPTQEYFDKFEKKLNDDRIPINNYDSMRQWIEINDKKEDIEKGLRTIFGSEKNYEYVFDEYSSFSDGIKNVINVLSLLIFIEQLSKTVFKGKKTIVLIDEIELFLHLQSQVNFVNYLINTFPSFRFIFTSHSPILMQRIDNCSIYILDSKHSSLEIVESQYFFSCDDILAKSFGLSKYPDQLIDFLQYLDECKTNPNKFKVETYRTYLKSCRITNYNFNLLINDIILDFINYIKKNVKLKKGTELYDAIYS